MEESRGARLLAVEHRRAPLDDNMLRPAHRVRWIHIDNLADYEPVKQHADCSEVLLDGGLREALTKALHIPGDMHGLNVRQIVHAALRAEFRKRAGRIVIGTPSVFVLDVRCEEIEEPLRRPRLFEKQGKGLRANIGQALQRVQYDDFGGCGAARHRRTTPEPRCAPIPGASLSRGNVAT